MSKEVLNHLHTIAFTHRNLEVEKIGLLHIPLDEQHAKLSPLKTAFNLDELLMLSTCNRVEFSFVTQSSVDTEFIYEFLRTAYPSIHEELLTLLVVKIEHYQGMRAVEHAMSVASSIEIGRAHV